MLMAMDEWQQENVRNLLEINEKISEILVVMKKPESKFFKVMEVIGNAVGILGAVSILEIIRSWF
jgi:preprotein translocase subunit Sss1